MLCSSIKKSFLTRVNKTTVTSNEQILQVLMGPIGEQERITVIDCLCGIFSMLFGAGMFC
ncbi:MAG TPA: hypothetical protein DCQ97_11625 [Chitinophagaceae bacterium]|nr:hypothetical protein [Chitinophagaceae bacterium]